MKLIERLQYEPVALKFGTSGLRALVAEMTDLECYINTLGFIQFCQDNYPQLEQLYIAGDLRDSTPRILSAVTQAGIDKGLDVTWIGFVPTPVLAYKAFQDSVASVMVTGSHIPSDRNGIKYYKPDQELMKDDEKGLLNCVAKERQKAYDSESDQFDADGMLRKPHKLMIDDLGAKEYFCNRLKPLTKDSPLKGLRIGVYQQSAVGRDMLVDVLEAAGVKTIAFGRSDTFVPVDTENVTDDVKKVLADFASNNQIDAIVSTDGDSDRPLLAGADGRHFSGDLLGLITAELFEANYCVYPVSANDMLDAHFAKQGVEVEKTKIGSPYVISAMDKAQHKRVAGWEVNGGFMAGDNITYQGAVIDPLKTRDAFLPLLACLLAAKDKAVTLKDLFEALEPKRYGDAALVDMDSFERMQSIVQKVANGDLRLEDFFEQTEGYGKVESIDTTDGVRIRFDNNDVAHIRGSGNAPQLRIYATADTPERAAEIVNRCVKKNGIFSRLAEAA